MNYSVLAFFRFPISCGNTLSYYFNVNIDVLPSQALCSYLKTVIIRNYGSFSCGSARRRGLIVPQIRFPIFCGNIPSCYFNIDIDVLPSQAWYSHRKRGIMRNYGSLSCVCRPLPILSSFPFA